MRNVLTHLMDLSSYFLQNVTDEAPFDEDENLRVLTFARTPIMSTYLVAFVVGEFDYVEGETEDGIVVRVYTPLGKAEQGQFGLEVRQLPLLAIQKFQGIFSYSSLDRT